MALAADVKDEKDIENADLGRVSTSAVGQSNGSCCFSNCRTPRAKRLTQLLEYTDEQYKKLTRKIDRYLIPIMWVSRCSTQTLRDINEEHQVLHVWYPADR